MKIFWAIVGVLLLGATIMMMGGTLDSGPQSPTLNAPQIAPARGSQAQQAGQPADAPTAAIVNGRTAEARSEAEAPASVEIEVVEAEVPSDPAPGIAAGAEPPAEFPAELAEFAFIPEPAPAEPVMIQVQQPEAQATEFAAEQADDAIASAPASAGATQEPSGGATGADPLAFEVAADGTLTIGGRVTVPGQGTSASPYEIPWDLLVSAQSTYRSRQTPGQEDELPAWSQALHGKHVRVKGFLMLPMTGDSGFSELLLMRNQWDGCCAGLPPTAYDAIEVSMAEPAKIDRWTTNYGTLVGRFEVDPFLSGGWVIGLWLLKDAAFEDASGVGTIGHWGGGS